MIVTEYIPFRYFTHTASKTLVWEQVQSRRAMTWNGSKPSLMCSLKTKLSASAERQDWTLNESSQPPLSTVLVWDSPKHDTPSAWVSSACRGDLHVLQWRCGICNKFVLLVRLLDRHEPMDVQLHCVIKKGFRWRGKRSFSHTSIFNAVRVKYQKGTTL